MSKKNTFREDREFQKEFEESFKVSNIFANKVVQGLSGSDQSTDPNGEYSEDKLAGKSPNDLAHIAASEGYSQFHVDYNQIAAAAGLQHLTEPVSPQSSQEQTPRYRSLQKESQQTMEDLAFTISKNQYRAIQKYATLVDFLGSPEGDKLAQKMLCEVNKSVSEQVAENTRNITERLDVKFAAKTCLAERKNLKQTFEGNGWRCIITASGPFTGNEAFVYKQDEDKSYIIRAYGEKYSNVSDEFNIVHDIEETPEAVFNPPEEKIAKKEEKPQTPTNESPFKQALDVPFKKAEVSENTEVVELPNSEILEKVEEISNVE